MRTHEENTVAVVDLLTSHPAVSRVCYPDWPTTRVTKLRHGSKHASGPW
jgi:cystathionine beta-lyase/cystathionine gamma-synthase